MWPRGLIEDHEFAQQREAMGLDAKDLDNASWGLTWAIATDPEVFPEIAWGIRIAVLRPHGNIPSVMILFRIDDDAWECEFLWIEAI